MLNNIFRVGGVLDYRVTLQVAEEHLRDTKNLPPGPARTAEIVAIRGVQILGEIGDTICRRIPEFISR